MSDHITIVKVPGTWVVLAGGAILGETKAAMELTEGDYPPVIYFPREDVAMAFLDQSDTRSTCPWKGEARYFSIVTKSTTLKDAAWSYESPVKEAERIKGHIAFYPEKATVERI
ncbi:hypothetical protein GCM10008024_10150 [Allgaiera indica]|uniref:Uncharacterized conserved protein, DUF427 family n=1 Tax=Allgaiera indica TaxID=765699 RepID=A0AAN4UPK8_9RHOB|nr:DUF427 domain-containing protein [Allgaiera indica]GHE00038.1 hypothetical protein GCM10008024_10150 [Allgaiera indica]SDW38316.1 Uncharacterized conserved protein, DUF427 family [Allgaiera indica]